MGKATSPEWAEVEAAGADDEVVTILARTRSIARSSASRGPSARLPATSASPARIDRIPPAPASSIPHSRANPVAAAARSARAMAPVSAPRASRRVATRPTSAGNPSTVALRREPRIRGVRLVPAANLRLHRASPSAPITSSVARTANPDHAVASGGTVASTAASRPPTQTSAAAGVSTSARPARKHRERSHENPD